MPKVVDAGTRLFRSISDIRSAGIEQISDYPNARHQLLRQFEAFGCKRGIYDGHTGDIATWLVQARDQTNFNRVSLTAEKTTGIVDVAFLAAKAEGGPPEAKRSDTGRPTSSEASADNLS